MKYKAIIFDMDGTIIDTEHIWAAANKTLIERRGIPYTPELQTELYRHIAGLALHKSCAIIKDIVKLEDPLDSLIQEKRLIANALYSQGVIFIEGFVKFHAYAQKYSLAMGVATNADAHHVHLTNQALKLDSFFGEHIYSISSVGNIPKPKPDIYLHAAHKLRVGPHECLAIEDSAHGIAAAKAAGMHCIGINTSKNRHNLRHSDFIANHYDDIDLENLLGLKKAE